MTKAWRKLLQTRRMVYLSRVNVLRRTEAGDAPAWQGEKRKNTLIDVRPVERVQHAV